MSEPIDLTFAEDDHDAVVSAAAAAEVASDVPAPIADAVEPNVRSDRPRPVARELGTIRSFASDARFPLLGSGYAPAAVDRFLDELDAQLSQAQHVEQAHSEEIDVLERALESDRLRHTLALADLQERLDRTQEESDAARADADEEAASIVATARHDADAIREAAQADADLILQAAHDRASRLAPGGTADSVLDLDASPVEEAPHPGGAEASLPVRELSTPLDGSSATATMAMAIEAIRAIADMAISQMSAVTGAEPPSARPARAAAPRLPTTVPRRADRPLLDADAEFLATLRRSVADRPGARLETDTEVEVEA